MEWIHFNPEVTINKCKVKTVNLKIIKMQTWTWDTVMVDQACAKCSMCCNVKVRNKRQKQKINSDVTVNLWHKAKNVVHQLTEWWWWIVFVVWLTFSPISSQDHCQRSSLSWVSDMPWAGFEPAQNLSSGFVDWSNNHYRLKVKILKEYSMLLNMLGQQTS